MGPNAFMSGESVFLNADELRQLTGYKYAARQVRWLIDHRIPHYVNGAGRPIVLRSFFEEGRLDRANGPQAHQRLRAAP